MPQGRRFATCAGRQAIAVLRGDPYICSRERENAGSRKACGGVFLRLTEKIFVSTNIFS